MDFELRFSDKEITPWGGMVLMKRFLDHLGWDAALRTCSLPPRGSNRGYPPEQLIAQFMLSVWCGANRFEHTEVTRFDPVLQRLFGWSRMANCKAILRLFNKFDQPTSDRVFDNLYRWLFDHIGIDSVTLDLDSTVMTRYGAQLQGATRGYNPAKRGRASHHPLLAFVCETRTVANCWLRPGNAASSNNAIAFLANTRARLGRQHVGLLRADSGFGDNAFLDHLEQAQQHYIVALRQTQPLQRALVGLGWQHALREQAGEATQSDPNADPKSDPNLPPAQWWPLRDDQGRVVPGIELTRLSYRAAAWSKPRWVTAIRQHIERRVDAQGHSVAKGKTLNLFADDPVIGKYRYSALVSDLSLPATAIWRLYRGRADCENRIKELKYDFGADSFNCRSFWATEATLNTVMLAFNLMSLWRQAVLKTSPVAPRAPRADTPCKDSVQHTLQTLRYRLFAVPAYTTTQGRKALVHLAVAMQKRAWLQGLWDAANAVDLPVKFTPREPPLWPP